MKRKFECKRSGYCCSNLKGMTEGKEHGIYLTPEEAKLFPEGTVFPLFRAGDNIFAYQTGSHKCPNLVEEGDHTACRIYENRPLLCRSFPAGWDENDRLIVLLKGCSCTADYPDADWDMASFSDCFQAAREQAVQEASNPRATEMFILNGKRWVKL